MMQLVADCIFLVIAIPNTTVNREYFVVKIFSDSQGCAKIKRTKYMHIINENVVQGHLSEII